MNSHFLCFRPPAIVRVDTYPPEKHLVDITVNETFLDFMVNQEAFMNDLYEYMEPETWVPKLESFAFHRERYEIIKSMNPIFKKIVMKMNSLEGKL